MKKPNDPTQPRKLPSPNYSKADATKILNVSSRMLDLLLHQRKIAHVKIGRRVLFTPEHLQAFMEKNTVMARTN